MKSQKLVYEKFKVAKQRSSKKEKEKETYEKYKLKIRNIIFYLIYISLS